jgi:hypothetical protein
LPPFQDMKLSRRSFIAAVFAYRTAVFRYTSILIILARSMPANSLRQADLQVERLTLEHDRFKDDANLIGNEIRFVQ